jgi:hypothetical protein
MKYCPSLRLNSKITVVTIFKAQTDLQRESVQVRTKVISTEIERISHNQQMTPS